MSESKPECQFYLNCRDFQRKCHRCIHNKKPSCFEEIPLQRKEAERVEVRMFLARQMPAADEALAKLEQAVLEGKLTMPLTTQPPPISSLKGNDA